MGDVRRAGGGSQAALIDHLRRVYIFKDLRKEEIEALFDKIQVLECPTGTVFFAPDHPSERLFFLKIGQVELYRLMPDGKRLVIRRIGPGTIFGEMGLLGQTLQGNFAEATEESLVCVATKDEMLRLLKQHPDVALRLLEAIGNRLKALEEQLEQATFSSVRVRLASFLLAHMDVSGAIIGYTQTEIGDAIGAQRQTVSEALSRMQNEGMVEVAHKRIFVKNPKALKDIVHRELGERF